MVHRDIKPENMILDRWGKVKVVDFGLARVAGTNAITRVGTVVGSLYYVSPEQLLGRQLDGRADVYALGVALYEMLTGKRPFLGKNLAELSRAILMGPLEAPGKLESTVPPDLEAILLKALERDREKRYGSAGELEEELRRWAASSAAQERKEPATLRSASTAVQAEAHAGHKIVSERAVSVESRSEQEEPTPPAEQKASVPQAERKGMTQQTPAVIAPQPPARTWSALGKPRADPSLPPITLRTLPQAAASPAEPRAAPETERAARPPAKLPDKPAGPTKAAEMPPEEEDMEQEEPSGSDLLKTAATHLQRLVWRLKKE